MTAGCGLILDRNRGSKNSHLIALETRLGTYVSDDLCELAHTRSALRAIFSIPQGLIFGMGGGSGDLVAPDIDGHNNLITA